MGRRREDPGNASLLENSMGGSQTKWWLWPLDPAPQRWQQEPKLNWSWSFSSRRGKIRKSIMHGIRKTSKLLQTKGCLNCSPVQRFNNLCATANTSWFKIKQANLILESGCIGMYIPSDLKISLGPLSGNLLVVRIYNPIQPSSQQCTDTTSVLLRCCGRADEGGNNSTHSLGAAVLRGCWRWEFPKIAVSKNHFASGFSLKE